MLAETRRIGRVRRRWGSGSGWFRLWPIVILAPLRLGAQQSIKRVWCPCQANHPSNNLFERDITGSQSDALVHVGDDGPAIYGYSSGFVEILDLQMHDRGDQKFVLVDKRAGLGAKLFRHARIEPDNNVGVKVDRDQPPKQDGQGLPDRL